MEYEILVNPDLSEVNVSVITPVYNVEMYLRETLDSLVNQTLGNIEIIMVDDGSSDNSLSILLEYAKKYNNIVVLKQVNAGPGVARNNGLNVARGEFINFVDSDDILPKDALESMYNAAIERNADIITGASLSFNTRETWFISSHNNNGVYKKGEKNLVRNPELLYSLGPCNKMFRAELIKDIRFPKHIKVTEDQPFIIEAYLRAKKIFTIDKVIYNYRSREEDQNLSLSQTVRVNSVNVLKDIFNSLSISDKLWDSLVPNKVSANRLKSFYYNRIISADIRPAIYNAIKSKDAKTQETAFTLLLNWLKDMDYKCFNSLPLLHRLLTYQMVDFYLSLSNPARRIHLEWLKICFNLIDPGSLQRLETSSKAAEVRAAFKAYKRNSTIPIWSFLSKRKFRKRKNKTVETVKRIILRRIIFQLACFLPIQKKITLATNKFPTLADSFKLVYEQLVELRPHYKVVGQFRKKRNFREFCRFYFDLATSRYVILDDYYRPLYNFKLRKGTEVIQLWHAAGAFKKFGHSAVGYAESNTREFENRAHQSYTSAVVSCREIIPFYAEAFKLPENRIYPLGLPRTDVFFNAEYLNFNREKYYGIYPELLNKKVITYAPTFRGGPGKRSNFKIKLDLKQMAEELSDEYVLILKMHPSVSNKVSIPEEVNDFVLDLSKNDMNDVLAITDILITDYSSIVFEYALLEKPMIFYAYDLENYLEDRSFYYEYEDFIPGPLAKTTSQVINNIKEGHFDIEKVKEFKYRFFDYLDGKSAQRFVEELILP